MRRALLSDRDSGSEEPLPNPAMPFRPEPAPGRPGQPSQPSQPSQLFALGQPSQPGQPSQLFAPGQPSQPGQPFAPSQPGQLFAPGQPGQPDQSGRPERRSVAAGLGARVRCRGTAAHVRQLDLSGAAMDAAQWRQMSRDALPAMPDVETLCFARMDLDDRSLAELMRGCRVGHFDGEGSPSGLARGGGERAVLRNLRVLDLSENHFTHRSATPLGKLLLWAADTLDELHLSGNPLRDYGFQIIGIYLSKLQAAALGKEQHLFPPGLVRQYAEIRQRSKPRRPESRLRGNLSKGSWSAPADRQTSHRNGRISESHIDSAIRAIHLGIALLDVRECRASVRGISALLAGASRAHRLKTLYFDQNSVIPRSLISLDVSSDKIGASAAAGEVDEEIDNEAGISSSSTIGDTSRFSKFEELHYPSALVGVKLCGVPLSKVCSPIGCRELFLNLFFCCSNLQLLDISESFDCQQVPSAVLEHLLGEGRNIASNSQVRWRVQREREVAVEFTLEEVYIGRQAFVAGVLCELLAHAAFNAQLRRQVPPLAFRHLRELYINGTGLTDRAAHGLEVAVRSVAVTGIFSSLVVLNAADNLLTVDGCTFLLKAFVLEWPVFPSVLSALALQGNVGITRNNIDALGALRHTCELAVLRRREEQQQIRNHMHEQEKQPLQSVSKPLPLPLSIHFGAFEADTMCVASDGSVDSSRAHLQQPQAAETLNETSRGEEYFPTFYIRPEKNDGSGVAHAAGSAGPLFAEVPASASFAPEESPTSYPSYAANATASAAAVTATAHTMKDLSSIYAYETPRRLFGLAMATTVTPPSFFGLQHHHERSPPIEKDEHVSAGTRPSKISPLISPPPEKQAALQPQNTERMHNLPVAETNSRGNALRPMPQSVAPRVAVSQRSEDAWAAAVASARAGKNNEAEEERKSAVQTRVTAVSANASTAQRPPLPPSVSLLQKLPQQQQTANVFSVSERHAREVPAPTASQSLQPSTSSMALSIGRLFASMDVRESNNEIEKNNASTVTAGDRAQFKKKSITAIPLDDAPRTELRLAVFSEERHQSVTNDRTKSHSPKSEVIAKALEEAPKANKGENELAPIQTRKETAWLLSHSNSLPNSLPGSGMSPLLPEGDEDDVSFDSLLGTNESSSVKQRRQEGVTSGLLHGSRKRLLGSCFENLDFRDAPLSVSSNVVGDGVNKGEQVNVENLHSVNSHTDDKVFTVADVAIDQSSSAFAKKVSENVLGNPATGVEKLTLIEPQQSFWGNVSTSSPSQEIQISKPDKTSRSRSIKTFVLTYHHPVGHLLCSGWRILSSKGPEGANARARFEDDVHALVEPPQELRQDGAVLSSVTVVMPFLDNSLGDCGNPRDSVKMRDGAVRIQFTSNERRVVLAERLQKNANVYDERTAFPRFTEVLDQALDTPFGDVIRVVDSLLQVAEESGVGLPRMYYEKSTATIVHERHGGEDALINELRALLFLRAEESVLPNVLHTPKRHSKEILTEASSRGILETDEKIKSIKKSSTTQSTKEEKFTMSEKRLRKTEPLRTEALVKDGKQSVTESAEGAEAAVTNIESSSAEAVIEGEHLTKISALISDQHDQNPQQQEGHKTRQQEEQKTQQVDALKPAGRLRTFILSLPHSEGHLLCRAWSLLHRPDAPGDEARAALQKDLREALRLPPAESSRESVEITREGASATMQLRVTTSERRAVVSKRLQCDGNGEPIEFPRLAMMLSSEKGKRCDTIRGVEAFLHSQTVLPALRERVFRRYRTAAALVHYYHTDTAALLHELGAASLTAVEDAVDLEDYVGPPHEHREGDEIRRSVTKKYEKEAAQEEEEGREKEEEKEGKKEEGVKYVTCLPPSPHSAGGRAEVQAPASPVSISPPRGHTTTQPGLPNTPHVESKRTFFPLERAVHPGDNAFEERMRRLQYLAYDAVRYGAILLDRQQRHKQRICKGKCDRQHVTVAVEWDVFLVVYFVRHSAFGRVARKTLVLVHPIAVGVRCFVPGDNRRDVIISIERSYGPDELGISSSEIERKLHEQLRQCSRAKNSATPRNKSVSRNVTPLESPVGNFTGEHLSTTSAGSNVSLTTNESVATGGLPDALQLRAMNVSLRLTLGSAEKAQETAIAIETAGMRATAMIHRTIREQFDRK